MDDSTLGNLFEPLKGLTQAMVALLPRVAIAAVVVILGWVLARVLRFLTVRVLRAFNMNVITERAGIDRLLKQGGLAEDAISVVGLLVYGSVLVAALMVAFNGLGLTTVTDLLSRVLWFLPHVFAAILVVVLGAYVAKVVETAVRAYCRAVKVPDAELLGRAARLGINVFVVLIALDQLGIGGDIIRQTFLIVLSGLVLAMALAFGIGGRYRAAALIEKWWPLRQAPPSPVLRTPMVPKVSSSVAPNLPTNLTSHVPGNVPTKPPSAFPAPRLP